MKLRALLFAALLADVLLLAFTAPFAAADVDPCREKNVSFGEIQVIDENPCTQGTAYYCVPKNKQGDWNCTPVGLWCWCPGPYIG